MGVLLHLSFFWGALWEAAFDGVPFFPPGIWDAENRIVLSNVSRLFGLSLFVLGHFSILVVGLGFSIKWARVAKFFGPIMNIFVNLRFEFLRKIVLFLFWYDKIYIYDYSYNK